MLYAIRGLKTNLLGLLAITSLELLCRIDAVTCDSDTVHVRYAMLFKVLGTLGDKYTIKLKDNAIPYSLSTPRHVAIPLREKVKRELGRMETAGVISKVTEPTPWCAGMVVVPKRDGTVRICVNFKVLNGSVLREIFPIPKVDDTLAQLAGATIFSKTDANSGFWQIPLTGISRPLTTFITPYGRYLFNKLPFGISCAPGLFQLRMNKVLEGLEGVVCQMDDVLVFDTTQEQHDQRLIATLKRIKEAGVSLNKAKWKLLYAADALSRAPTSPTTPMEDDSLQDDAEILAATAISSLPAGKQRVRWYCQNGWPGKHDIESMVKPYWESRCSLTMCNDLLLFDDRIVVPLALQKETLDKIHEGHQGIDRCRVRAKSAVWWPGLSKQLIQKIQQCHVCVSTSVGRQAPLMVSPTPDYPWQVVGTDFFELDRKHFLVVMDYFSRYAEVVQMNSTTTTCTITALKNIFARHGIPEIVRSDNGPQYSSHEFAAFAKAYQFQHITSSPLFPQSNSQGERMVQTIKKLFRKSDDIYQGLLSYRSTPLPWCNLSS